MIVAQEEALSGLKGYPNVEHTGDGAARLKGVRCRVPRSCAVTRSFPDLVGPGRVCRRARRRLVTPALRERLCGNACVSVSTARGPVVVSIVNALCSRL